MTLQGRCASLVADSVSGHLSLKLSKGEQDIHYQTTQTVRCIEVLGNACESDAISLERVKQAHKVQQAPAEPIQLVDDNHVNAALFDVGQ